MNRTDKTKETWESSFKEQIATRSFNTAPVEALVRTVSYYLRSRHTSESEKTLHFLEMGCGAAPTLVWLARRGIRVSGIDVSPTALRLAKENLENTGVGDRIGKLLEGSVTNVPFEAASFDGVLESCVFQHLNRKERKAAFHEVRRVLKPGGIFVGQMLDQGHSVFVRNKTEQLENDPGTLILESDPSKVHLTGIGLSHFYSRDEIEQLLEGFQTVDPCLTTYYLPREEAQKRGYDEYLQSMWIVYAVK